MTQRDKKYKVKVLEDMSLHQDRGKISKEYIYDLSTQKTLNSKSTYRD